MAVFIALAAAAVGSAISGAASASAEKKKQQTEIQNRIDAINAEEKARKRSLNQALSGEFAGQFGIDDIFGTKPNVIDPVDINQVLSRNVAQIRDQGLPAALEFTGDINRQFADETLGLNLERIRTLIPNFDAQSGLINTTSESLLRGELPFEDVLGIVSDRQSLAASLGTPGGSAPATLKDLGINRLTAIQTGQNMFQSFAATLQNAISPTPSFARGDQLLPFTSLTAGGRVQGELAAQEQAQLAEILRASEDPRAAELFNEEFLFNQRAAGLRSGVAVPNVSGAVAGQAIGAGVTAAGAAFQNQQNQERQDARTDRLIAASATS